MSLAPRIDSIELITGGIYLIGSSTQPLTIDRTNSRVGIGITGPTAPFHVKAAALISGNFFRVATFEGTEEYNAGAGAGIDFVGKYTSGGTVTTFAQIVGKKESTVSGEYHGYLGFFTRSAITGQQEERMRILGNSGYIGIGTISPFSTLSIGGAGTRILSIRSSDTGDVSGIKIIGSAGTTDTDSNACFLKVVAVTGNVGGLNIACSNSGGTLANIMRVNGDSTVLIGTTTKETKGVTIYATGTNGMYIRTTATTNYWITNCDSGVMPGAGTIATIYNGDTVAGAITVTGNTTAYTSISDQRLKNDAGDFDALSMITGCQARKYEWKAKPGEYEYGFFAQDLNSVVPQAVIVGGDDVINNPWAIDYSKVTGVLWKAIQELNAKVDAQAAEIEALKQR